MVQLIVSNTNAKIQHIKDNLPPYYNRSSKNTFIRPLDQHKLYKFIGLLYAWGLLRQSLHSYKMLFSETAGHPVFSATMSKHRFSFLYVVLSFDDPEEWHGHWRNDWFAAARELTIIFNDRMKSVLVPSEYLSIDETLYAMHHQINFRQYNPNELAKYGLLCKSLKDARFPFTYQVVPYCRKPVEGTSPYYLNATEDYVKHLVQSMSVSSMKERNIPMDQLYTSISTSNWLLKHNITLVGTLVSNCIGLLDEVKDASQQDEFESTMHWEQEHGNLALCAYTTKSKSKGKKNVLLLSTMWPLFGVTPDDRKRKPAIIKFFDFTKGGTDILDQKILKYSYKSVTQCWTMVHFCFWWITSAVTLSHCMRLTMVKLLIKPMLSTMVGILPLVWSNHSLQKGPLLVWELVCETRFLSCLGEMLMRLLKPMIMLNIPSMAK